MNLSPEGLKLLLDYEVGGGESYFRKFLSRPTWPGEQSGVTIGVGFDLGYNTEAQYSEAWGPVLADTSFDLLRGALGIRGDSARLWLHSRDAVRTIELTWKQALDVFTRITVPRFYMQTMRIYPQAENLPPPARDALISLVFNRGAALAGDRRAEMLGIQNALRDGRLYDVPDLLRSMKRLWPNTTGLQKRRDAEALLFESAVA